MPGIEFGTATGLPLTTDSTLTRRIVSAYSKSLKTSLGDTDSMWLHGPLLDMRRDIHEALLSDDLEATRRILDDPGKTNLFNGFEDLNKSFKEERLPTLDRNAFAASEFLGLVELGRAVGALKVRHHNHPEPALPDVEDLLVRLDEILGFHVEFPNPFPGEVGLSTSRGILSYRAPPAIYQAWRIRQLVRELNKPRVVEIGAGLGRTAYYAKQMGIVDYTIVDLPITLVAQADFLGRVLGEDTIQMFGEAMDSSTKLMPPSQFLMSNAQYDLALNADSMTEMARNTAQSYCNAIHNRAGIFLSINHEGLSFTVAELMPNGMFMRSPYWMRPGYVEELGGRYPIGKEITFSDSLARQLRRWRSRAELVRRFRARRSD